MALSTPDRVLSAPIVPASPPFDFPLLAARRPPHLPPCAWFRTDKAFLTKYAPDPPSLLFESRAPESYSPAVFLRRAKGSAGEF
ncbi:hypothetical protein MJG53_008929 [Ovis ammon polii x Ovis aries]|uniref:Uncharacterized protein n=1 Tax=Ovis ammon polii x Ovis aries TaxID=2918886 RepID=A0ACB9UXV8_9CETA|nr:hypothetical protein MJT46_008563 [Ovis ammon polii x Ovis aries]KAI4582378.1 hypothetical protein MJG53_008929 [Ovis ammon polii x Ovis aries]